VFHTVSPSGTFHILPLHRVLPPRRAWCAASTGHTPLHESRSCGRTATHTIGPYYDEVVQVPELTAVPLIRSEGHVDPNLAAQAVDIVREYLNRAYRGVAMTPADMAAQRVLAVLEQLSAIDPATRAALHRLQAMPHDQPAGAQLRQRVAQVAAGVPDFERDLAGAVQATALATTPSAVRGQPTAVPPPAAFQVPPQSAPPVFSVPPQPGPPVFPAIPPFAPPASAMPPGVPLPVARPPKPLRQRRRLALILTAVAAAVVVLCAGGGFVYLFTATTYLDQHTKLVVDGWQYQVSEAHLHTAATMNGKSATPGNKYLYFDIDVTNLLGDRSAPGIGFHFARPVSSLGAGCGAGNTTLFNFSSYSSGVVSGYCVSDSGSLLGGGTSCYDGTGLFGIHTLGDISQHHTTSVRCVDPLFASDTLDLARVRVYFVESDVPNLSGSYQNVVQIPTS
jgi:hypothetical protein